MQLILTMLFALMAPTHARPLAITPSVPSADQFHPGLQTGTLDCNASAATLVGKAVANKTLYRFCAEHQGLNIELGGNSSSTYDANATRLHLSVFNQCGPQGGLYLPWDTCVSGFTRLAQCTADCGWEWTGGGHGLMDCIGFDLSAEAINVPVSSEQVDGVVVTCEGLCGA